MREPEETSDPRGEDAAAATEFAVLLPVYLLLFVCLFTLGQAVLIRQKLVMAARFQAWLNRGPSNIGQAMFGGFLAYAPPGGGYHGQNPTSDIPNPSDFGFNASDFANTVKTKDTNGQAEYDKRIHEPAPSSNGGNGGNGNGGNGNGGNGNGGANATSTLDAASNLAAAVWNDAQVSGNQVNPRVHLEWRGAKASFDYAPSWLAGFPLARTFTPNCSCYVLGRRLTDSNGTPIERKVYRPNAPDPDPSGRFVSDHHPIEDIPDRYSFQISKPTQGPNGNYDMRYFPPDIPDPNFQNEKGQHIQPRDIDANVPPGSTDGTNPGIWNTGLRVGQQSNGDDEHSFFSNKLGVP